MTTTVELGTLSPQAVAGLDVRPSGVVDLRRDVHHFVRFVQERGLRRTHRENRIPLGDARRLARLLSWAGEKDAVKEERRGVWSGFVCDVARELGLVSYDTKGVYAGYSSMAPSFPENDVEVEAKAWRAWGGKSALQKERALLGALVKATPSEFFERPTLLEGEAFDPAGCLSGPAGKMPLAKIRRILLGMLATLEPGTWIEFTDLVDLLGSRYPQLILDPAHREPTAESRRAQYKWDYQARRREARGPKPPLVLEDLYVNFREDDPKAPYRRGKGMRQLTSQTSGIFRRVEGRYLEFFLREIPYLLGYVDLAFRTPSDRHGLDVLPPLERLRAVRTTPRLRAILGHEAAFDTVKVTVLPTFEILVEAPSYPDSTLDALAPYTRLLSEEPHLRHLRLEKSQVVAAAAEGGDAPPCAALLEELSGGPLPQNVAFELARWTARGERVTLREGLGILEIAGKAHVRKEAIEVLGDLVEEEVEGPYVLVREPEQAFERLETRGLVPLAREHPAGSFAPGGGGLGRTKATRKRKGTKRSDAAPVKARLSTEDLVGYRSDVPELLDALQKALPKDGGFRASPNRLVVPSAWMPRVRGRLRALRNRFAVTQDEKPQADGEA